LDFHPQSDSALDRLTDDEIIDYISSARRAGSDAHMRQGIGILAFRRFDMVKGRIGNKVGADVDIEDIAMQVMTNAIEASFKGEHMGEFVNMLLTMTARRIADFHAAKKPESDPYPTGDGGDENNYIAVPGIDGHEGFSVTRDLVMRDLDDLSPSHRLVVIYDIRGDSAAQIADIVNNKLDPENPMTSTNVHKITSRFRERMHVAIRGAG